VPVLSINAQRQINEFYCGPAATRAALSARGLTPSQAELATALGTTSNGTNSVVEVSKVLNQYLGAGTYEPTFIGGTDATEAQRNEFRSDLRKSIDAGFALVCNVVGKITTFDGEAYEYKGGHYVTAIGYDVTDDSVCVFDVNVKTYWTTTAKMATWIAGRGYSSAVNVTAPTPPPPDHAPAPELGAHVLFVDVSNHDRDRRGAALDWASMAGAGVGSVMVAKATEGNPNRSEWYEDPWFNEMQTGATLGGYGLRGAYHVLAKETEDSGLMAQINALRQKMDQKACTFGMIDVEPFQELADKGIVPDWWTVVRFNDLWATVERRKLIWYISRNMWNVLGSPDLTRIAGLLTCANYPNVKGTTPEAFYGLVKGNNGVGWTPYGGRTPDIWQFGSDAVIAGASALSDINAYRGTLADLAAALAPTPEAPPEPTPGPDPEPTACLFSPAALAEALRPFLLTKEDVGLVVRAELDRTKLGA
jgi:GH25 family lysozyme M1 (1,4-beta-N-acetylmuramidase)